MKSISALEPKSRTRERRENSHFKVVYAKRVRFHIKIIVVVVERKCKPERVRASRRRRRMAKRMINGAIYKAKFTKIKHTTKEQHCTSHPERVSEAAWQNRCSLTTSLGGINFECFFSFALLHFFSSFRWIIINENAKPRKGERRSCRPQGTFFIWNLSLCPILQLFHLVRTGKKSSKLHSFSRHP